MKDLQNIIFEQYKHSQTTYKRACTVYNLNYLSSRALNYFCELPLRITSSSYLAELPLFKTQSNVDLLAMSCQRVNYVRRLNILAEFESCWSHFRTSKRWYNCPFQRIFTLKRSAKIFGNLFSAWNFRKGKFWSL